jgi:hypothetical protein
MNILFLFLVASVIGAVMGWRRHVWRRRGELERQSILLMRQTLRIADRRHRKRIRRLLFENVRMMGDLYRSEPHVDDDLREEMAVKITAIHRINQNIHRLVLSGEYEKMERIKEEVEAMKEVKMFLLLMTVAIMCFTGCSTEEIPPGHKGFMFDKTGPAAFYSGGAGLQKDVMLSSGTHYTGWYDTIVGVNCQDAHTKERLFVLTKSDMKVAVDLRITYSANCESKEKVGEVLTKISAKGGFVQPPQLFARYLMPVIRQSLRNNLANTTIEDVKNIRGSLSKAIQKDIDGAEKKFPISVKMITVSDITLPVSITTKIKEIEIARMEANKEVEKQKASKVRLKRELFEAEQDLKVKQANALKAKRVAEIDAQAKAAVKKIAAQADLDAKKLEAQGILEMTRRLTPEYLKYINIIKGAQVKMSMANAMSTGTKWYMNGFEFMVPPGTTPNVALSR